MKDIEKLKHMYKETFETEGGQKVLRDLEARANWRASILPWIFYPGRIGRWQAMTLQVWDICP